MSTSVSSGKSALTYLTKKRPHLVLLDACLYAHQWAEEFASPIRQTDDFLPIILVAGKAFCFIWMILKRMRFWLSHLQSRSC